VVEAARTFNLGIGMIIVASQEQAEELLAKHPASGPSPIYRIGQLVAGEVGSAPKVNLLNLDHLN
jgi:phosphoribosylaminoimidazole (AIR) synthetase